MTTPGIGVRHGWRPTGEPMLVTRSGGNRVYSLDDRPALDVYLERLGVAEASMDDGDRSEPASSASRSATTALEGRTRRTGLGLLASAIALRRWVGR
jgi:FIST N domain